MPICGKCQHDLPEDSFNKNKTKKNGLNNYCKSCMKVLRDAHYYSNKQAYIKRAAEATKETRKEFRELKASLGGCQACDETAVCCLDFHHLDPAEKDGTVRAMLLKGSPKKLMEEIGKCALLCANCHRKYHAGLLNVELRVIDVTVASRSPKPLV